VSGDLTFRAVVEKVECAPIGLKGAFLDWVIRTRVLEVIAGDFTGEFFAFRVHSPARSGLEAGVTCTIHAVWTGNGYTIDENQWSGNPR
jgi:hypothetical protein